MNGAGESGKTVNTISFAPATLSASTCRSIEVYSSNCKSYLEIDEDILRLDIAVNHHFLVRVLYTGHELPEISPRRHLV